MYVRLKRSKRQWRGKRISIGRMVICGLEYPDYMTQSETLKELQENLKDILKELGNGSIPYVRRVAELDVA